MADHHDAQDYKANGPTDIAFRTGGDGTGIKNGVVATGTKIGVHGIGRDAPGTTGVPVGVVGEGSIGIHGIGIEGSSTLPLGVVGEGFIGVSGRNHNLTGGSGVEGSGPTGVRGIGDNVGVRGESDVVGVSGVSFRNGTGVEGSSDSGIGVVGRSNSKIAGFFNSLLDAAVVCIAGGPGDGVRGRSTGSGHGVKGEADTGFGVFGDSEKQSGVVGRSRSAVAPGVFGVCDRLTGVAGRSIAAPGVFGQSIDQAGVMGFSTSSAGVFGFCNEAFEVPAPPVGVLGVNDKSVGVIGSSVEVIGVLGNTDRGLGVVGQANLGAGVPTDRITDQGIGVIGLANSGIGVAGMSTSGAGVFGLSQTGLAGHFKGPVLVEGDFTVKGGNKSAAVLHPDGTHKQLYCVESPESWFEDFGEGQLVDGKAEVRLEPGFAALVELNAYHVFLTPYGDSTGLFVAERYATGFRVSEHKGGASTLSFAYRVVAKRKDVVGDRLATVTVPKISTELQLPDLRLQISTPDFERLSVSPFDLPGSDASR